MTMAELIEEVSRVVEMTRKDSEVIVEAIFDSVVKALRGGDKIEIRGFGSFRTRQRQPRVGRNPKTGARVDVPVQLADREPPDQEPDHDRDRPREQVVGRDQLAINGVAQVGQIDAAERSVPIRAIALAAIQGGARLFDQVASDIVSVSVCS